MWPEMGIAKCSWHPSLLINPQNSEIELQDQYSTNSFDLSLPLKLLILALRRAQEGPNVARNGYRIPSVHCTLCIKPQNSEIELQDQYSTNSFDLSFPLKLLILAFRRAQERPNVARNGYRIPSVHCTLCIKPQNSEIELQDQYSTNSFDLSFPLKLLILAFRRAQERPYVARNGYRIPSVHCSLCIKPQNSKIELQDQYSTNSFDLSLPLKPLILAFRRAQEHPNVARNGYRIPSVDGTLPYASSLKTPKLNCKTNTQPILLI